ncbi:MAG TPA: TMEM43 family protein [Candidatus Omnitrophota bacterium]|nr:TMEM43 family protein [Candidatus Omnitrophota bacterium]
MDDNLSQPIESSSEKDSSAEAENLQKSEPQSLEDKLKQAFSLPRFRQDDPSYMDTPHIPIDNIFLGVLLIIIGVVSLFYSESKAIQKKDLLQREVNTILTIPIDRVDYRNGGKIVHVSGIIDTKDVLHDASFGVMANAVKLKRDVEMYQWQEYCVTKEKPGEYDEFGIVKTETTCRYEKKWSTERILSRYFKDSSYRNPEVLPFQSRTWVAKNVKIGVFKLWPQLVDKMQDYEPFAILSLDYVQLPRDFRSEKHLVQGALYLGKDPQKSEIGDIRVSYKIIRPFQMMTVIARQAADSLAPFEGQKGEVSSQLLKGSFSPQSLFYPKSIKEKSVWFIWWVRVIVFGMLFAGLHLSLCPLRIISYYIPLLRQFLGVDFGSVIFSFTFLLYFLVLGFSWYPHNLDLARIFLGISLIPILFCRVLAGTRK